jgi:serine protease Do
MKKYMKIFTPVILASAIVLFCADTANSQSKKKNADKLDDSEQIIIKWKADMDTKGDKGSKGGKDVKLTIEIKDDLVLVNGKPLSEFNDEELAVLKKDVLVMDGNTFGLAMPSHPRSAFQGNNWSWSDDQNHELDDLRTELAVLDGNNAFLGVSSEDASEGVKIMTVNKGSAAEKAGIKKGDILTKIDGNTISSATDLTNTIGKYKPGNKISVTIKRAGAEQKLNAILGKRLNRMYSTLSDMNRFPEGMQFNVEDFMDGRPKLGIKAQDTEDGKGVKILDVDQESAAEKAGLQEDDIITSFDGKEINSVTELVDASRAAKDAKKSTLPVKFRREDKEQTVELRIPRKLKTAEL